MHDVCVWGGLGGWGGGWGGGGGLCSAMHVGTYAFFDT